MALEYFGRVGDIHITPVAGPGRRGVKGYYEGWGPPFVTTRYTFSNTFTTQILTSRQPKVLANTKFCDKIANSSGSVIVIRGGMVVNVNENHSQQAIAIENHSQLFFVKFF